MLRQSMGVSPDELRPLQVWRAAAAVVVLSGLLLVALMTLPLPPAAEVAAGRVDVPASLRSPDEAGQTAPMVEPLALPG